LDPQGVRVPDAENELKFEVTGPAKIIGLENGSLNTIEPYGTERRQAYRGRGLTILQSTQAAGKITLKASAFHLASATITLDSR
jgi:beta-galactosidase